MAAVAFDISSMTASFGKLSAPLTVSDLTLPDQPLVYFNPAFAAMTGYGQELLGRNCRVLQGDLENDDARAEVRLALAERRQTQVILHNRRKDGTPFYNLLLMGGLGTFRASPEMAVGAQFDLGPVKPGDIDRAPVNTLDDAAFATQNRVLTTAIERRRTLFDAAIRLGQSWLRMHDIAQHASR